MVLALLFYIAFFRARDCMCNNKKKVGKFAPQLLYTIFMWAISVACMVQYSVVKLYRIDSYGNRRRWDRFVRSENRFERVVTIEWSSWSHMFYWLFWFGFIMTAFAFCLSAEKPKNAFDDDEHVYLLKKGRIFARLNHDKDGKVQVPVQTNVYHVYQPMP